MTTALGLAVDFLVTHEACKLDAYPDPGSRDGTPWTIGYGHTKGVAKGDTCTKAQARLWLREDLQDALEALRAKIGTVMAELTTHQRAALLCFVFNLGTGNPRKPEWTIWKLLRAKRFDQIPGQMILFVNNDGKKMQGLVNRRTDEIKLWSTEEPGSVDTDPPSSVTRSTPTPPTATDPTPPQKSAQVITAVTAAATAIPVAVNQITTTIAPYADHSALLQRIVGVLAVVGAVAAVTVLALVWLKKHRERGHA